MGDFSRIAGKIAERIYQGPIGIRELNDIVGSIFGNVNCYPGQKTDVCCLDALFVSLTSKHHKQGNGHLSLRDALEALVQHMMVKCKGSTQSATIITDNWQPDDFERWKESIELLISNGNQIEIYLLVHGRAIQVQRDEGGL